MNCKFRLKIYLINHVGAEALTTAVKGDNLMHIVHACIFISHFIIFHRHTLEN
jgi:hypothetical protein